MPAKKKAPIKDQTQLSSTIDQVARLEVQLRSLEATRDAAVQIVQEKHDGPIEELRAKIKTLTADCATYSKKQRASIFGKLRSAATALARYGFRTGNPSLCLLNRNWTWDQVLETLKLTTRFKKHIRIVEEIDKDGLKAAGYTDEELAAIGLRIDHKERFFIEPKSEDAERINEESAA